MSAINPLTGHDNLHGTYKTIPHICAERKNTRVKDLTETVRKMIERVRLYRDGLEKSEWMTRYALVDPFLAALGWDVSDPGTVIPEDNGAWRGRRKAMFVACPIQNAMGKNDYTICENGLNVLVVEAKKLGGLDDGSGRQLEAHRNQLLDYMAGRGVWYGLLTDGLCWKMYGMADPVDSPRLEFRIDQPEERILKQATRLNGWNWQR